MQVRGIRAIRRASRAGERSCKRHRDGSHVVDTNSNPDLWNGSVWNTAWNGSIWN